MKDNRYYLSDRSYKAAELLFENGYYEICVSRCYYSMFYLVQELLDTEGIIYSTHKGLISEFGKRYILNGDLDPEYGRILNKGYEKRMFGDYGQKDIVSREVALSSLEDTKRFNEKIKGLFPEE